MSVYEVNNDSDHESDNSFLNEIVRPVIEDRILVVDRSGSGKVHFILLSGSDKNASADPQNIDVYQEKWEQIYLLRDFGICVHEDYLYILGGFSKSSSTYLNTVKRYHTVHDIWEDLPPMIHARSNFSTVFSNGKIYVTGGVRSTGKATKSCEAFNFYSWTWERVGMLPCARKDHRVSTDGVRVYISGGEAAGRLHANIWLSEDHTWNKMDEDYPTLMSVCRSRHNMEYYNGVLYFIAGLTTAKSAGRLMKPTTDESRYAPLRHNSSLQQATTSHNPTQIYKKQEAAEDITVTVANSMESFMPFVTSSVMDDTNFISPWDWGLPPLKYPRYGAASIIIGNNLFILGGTGVDGKVVHRAEMYDFKERKWEDSFSLTRGNFSNVSCVRIRCSADRRKLHSPEALDIWSKYKWIMW